jgi:hypothetical protein
VKKQKPVDLDAAFKSILGEDHHRILGAFALMKVAEDVIKEEKPKWRGAATKERVHQSFALMCPVTQVSFMGFHVDLFAHHCRELVERVARKQDTVLATDAEVLLGLYQASLAAPLTEHALALYEHCFSKVFPEKSKEFFADGHRAREHYPGELQERLNEARRKLRFEKRKHHG